MDIDYFLKINNMYKSKSRQETDLYVLNRGLDKHFADTIDYHIVKRNGIPFEMLVIKDSSDEMFKKKIKSRHSKPFNLGDYIEWHDKIWIVTSVDTDTKAYHSGVMSLCTILLHWQNEQGKIIERWAYVEEDNGAGVTGDKVFLVGDNQFKLTLPIDDETKKLLMDMRFAIDLPDAKTPYVYKIISRDISTNNITYFNRGGILFLVVEQGFFNEETDKYVLSGNGDECVWVCDYKDNTGKDTGGVDDTDSDNTAIDSVNSTFIGNRTVRGVITGRKDLKCGFSRTYTVNFLDAENNVVDFNNVSFVWNIVADFKVQVESDVSEVEDTTNSNEYLIKTKENAITLSVSDDMYIGEQFVLQCKQINGFVFDSITINIVEGF